MAGPANFKHIERAVVWPEPPGYVSACEGDVSMGIAVSPIGRILLLLFETWKDGYIASTLDQNSVNEKEGDFPQARAITCRHVSSKTHCN